MIIRQMTVRPGQGLDLAMITSTPPHRCTNVVVTTITPTLSEIIIIIIILVIIIIIIIIIWGRAGQFNGSNCFPVLIIAILLLVILSCECGAFS